MLGDRNIWFLSENEFNSPELQAENKMKEIKDRGKISYLGPKNKTKQNTQVSKQGGGNYDVCNRESQTPQNVFDRR